MAALDTIKPFSPEEIQRILHHLQQPAVFINMTCDWPVLHWTAEHLSECLRDRLVRFRLGEKDETKTPLFETQCSYVEAKLKHFLNWTQGQTGTDVGPFSDYSISEYWAYADYKYIAMLFQDQPSMFEDVKWSEFGYEGRNGRESTLWIGTEGANTPCHLDSYGCNLVLQVQGRKRWYLFPPEDTAQLYPTRIPYEESSIFSQVDVLHPDLKRFPAFQEARAHVVTLQPGQDVDHIARVNEAVTKTVVCALKSAPSDDNTDDWLNPTEEAVGSHTENMQYVNLALRASAQTQRSLGHNREARPIKRDSRGQIKKHRDKVEEPKPFIVPFGPHLIPVHCQRENLPKQEGETDKKSSRNCDTKSQEVCFTASSNEVQRAELTSANSSSQCRQRDSADVNTQNPSEDYEEPVDTKITTNDLLDCLVHPDVIALVTKLLLERHTGSYRAMTP
ncbi:HSPB1-associated protein 1 homolog [Xyrichtys novacula]|uniref:HSPB1-associated protein 1 homolog n=1 Tax=Xyrichtys novacula TaxID=13765 RepID=A0AAV1GZP5_XYRNO|nr:HSPB1-associated protein 1 homolog [Xyrichtys novacula]